MEIELVGDGLHGGIIKIGVGKDCQRIAPKGRAICKDISKDKWVGGHGYAYKISNVRLSC